MAQSKPVDAALIEEWLRGTVTRALLGHLQDRADWLEQQRRQLYFPNEPQRTQEALAAVDGHQQELSGLLSLFTDHETLEGALNDDYHQRQRDLASRLSGSGPT